MNDPGRPRHPRFYCHLGPGVIRIFELEAGELSDPIVGRLVPQPTDGDAYEAVSYVWGDPQKRCDITINGESLSITANLHGALTALRHQPLGGSSSDEPGADTVAARKQPVRRLWVDAVCINQEDLQERTSQVELMSCIYAGARRVLSWLGWEESEEGRRHVQDAIRFIHSFMEDPAAGLSDARILLRHDSLADASEDLAHFSEDDQRRFNEQARKWQDIKFLFEIEYFHRTWIVQELGLAREAVLLTALKPAVYGAKAGEERAESQGVAARSKDWALEVEVIDWHLLGRFVEFLDYSGASLVTHIGLLSWVAHHILMVWATKGDGTPDCDFLTAMHWTRILGVTDARDRVFGLLGHPMAVVDGELVIHPDYTRTRGVIYTKLAVKSIQKTNNLYVVSLVDHEDDPSLEARDWNPLDDARMPSWVPDWHSINRTTPVDYPVAAAAASDSEISIEGATDGEEGTPLPHLLVRGWIVDEISAVSRRMETTDFPVTHLARERTKENPFWLDRVWELLFTAKEPGGNSMDDPGGVALAVLDSLSLALAFGTREKGEPVSKAGLNQTLEEHNRSFAAYVLEYHKLLHGALTGPGGVNNDDDKPLPVRSLLDSLPAEAQAELRRRAEGATSGGFIECMTWPSMCRVMYRTVSGLVGMGSRVTRPGDLVCRVRGQPVLMTLRRIRDSCASEGTTSKVTSIEAAASICCAHIGPTIVPARMKMGIIDGIEFGEMATNFRIL